MAPFEDRGVQEVIVPSETANLVVRRARGFSSYGMFPKPSRGNTFRRTPSAERWNPACEKLGPCLRHCRPPLTTIPESEYRHERYVQSVPRGRSPSCSILTRVSLSSNASARLHCLSSTTRYAEARDRLREEPPAHPCRRGNGGRSCLPRRTGRPARRRPGSRGIRQDQRFSAEVPDRPELGQRCRSVTGVQARTAASALA